MKNEIMQVKVFKLPVFSDSDEEDKLNKFLRSHRILQVVKAFSMDNGGSWTVLVEYMDGDQTEIPSSRRSAKDYSKELSPEEYERYSRFREIRKKISEEKNILDDVVLFSDDKELLLEWCKQYAAFLADHLKLLIHPVVLNRTRFGVPFLGYVVYPYYLRLGSSSKSRFKKRMAARKNDVSEGRITQHEYAMRVKAMYAFIEKANVRGFKNAIRKNGLFS